MGRGGGFIISAVGDVLLWSEEGESVRLIIWIDAFTYLGINSGNESGIKASLFSSKDVLGGVKNP